MRKFNQALGMLALALWTLAGAAAWVFVGEGLEITIQDQNNSKANTSQVFLIDRIKVLESDLRSLTQALESNLGALADSLQDEADRTSQVQTRRWQDLQTGLDGLAKQHERLGLEAKQRAELSRAWLAQSIAKFGPEEQPLAQAKELLSNAQTAPPMEPSTSLSTTEPIAALIQPQAQPIEPSEPEEAPVRRRSFLSFKLPSDDFSFDEEREWAILPQLSRVGFDGSSTLHDFSAVTSAVEGKFTVNLAHPERSIEGLIQAQAHSLNSGLEDRDEAMFEHLLTEKFEHLDFQLKRFVPNTVDPTNKRIDGTIEGTMSIRGVSREIAMSVKLSIDDSGRLNIEGQVPMKLSDFEIPVPNKLGLVKMKDQVQVWITLSARCVPRIK